MESPNLLEDKLVLKIFDLSELLKIATIKKQKLNNHEFIYSFLSVNKDFILENSNDFTIEELWYSEYYHLVCMKNESEYNFGYDAGFEQMCFKLLEIIQNQIRIDWDIICDLEEKASKNWDEECKL